MNAPSAWPVLSYNEAKETYQTLHLWTQIIGKIKLSCLPWINHSWHITLHCTPRGLSSGSIPYKDLHFQVDFDFIEHQVLISTSSGEIRQFGLMGLSVAEFYHKTFEALEGLNIWLKIYPVPSELENGIPFPQDHQHATYQPVHAAALHKALLKTQDVLLYFRSKFIGKSSPVHFFWGSFDLALSRFSGRKAPPHPGGIPRLPDWVAREAYSHEVSSCGFWPGNEAVPFAAFYAYIYPEPKGYKDARVEPPEAYYHPELKEFVLPYSVVQQATEPAKTLLDFLNTTYARCAELAHWDREGLEASDV